MRKRNLEKLGFAGKPVLDEAVRVCSVSRKFGIRGAQLKEDLLSLLEGPSSFVGHELYGTLAELVKATPDELADIDPDTEHVLREDFEYACWGDEEIDAEAHQQMANACQLPVSVKGALMPDAHLGYGLPIGGVLATDNAVIPYAVGVDIACRVMLTVFDTPYVKFKKDTARFKRAIEDNTRFGIGAKWRDKKQHDVMDMNWAITSTTKELKDLAWSQLGTSGSGNHFVEFGEIEFREQRGTLEAGKYLALVSHSGSRGPGSRVASHYSKLAMELHGKRLPKWLKHLSWLPMDGDGAEYWAAMELMGEYASANHHLIHAGILKHIGAKAIFQVENHHNFAWREKHDGRNVIVHRKGATPAAEGVLGYIPGSMTAPGYLVEGRGNKESLDSCSHGAGRQMSRKKAKNSTTRHELKKRLGEHGVELISAGLDESPHAYKDIDEVMRAQGELVKKIAKFSPKLVKMAPEGERPED